MQQVDYAGCVEHICTLNKGIRLEHLMDFMDKAEQDDEFTLVNKKPLMQVLKESRTLKMLVYQHGTFVYQPLGE